MSSGEMQTQLPFRRIPASRDSSSGTQEVSGDPQDLIEVVGPSLEGEAVHCAVYQIMFDSSFDVIQLCCGYLDVLMFCWMGIGRDSLWRGSNLGCQLTPFLYQACTEWCCHTSAW